MPERSYFIVVSCTALDVRRAAEGGARLYAAAREVAGSDALDAVSVQVLAFEAGELVEVLNPSGLELTPVADDRGVHAEPSIDPVVESWVSTILEMTSTALADWPRWLQRLGGRHVVGAVSDLEPSPRWQADVHAITTDAPPPGIDWRPQVGSWCTVLGSDPLVGGKLGEIVMYLGGNTWRVRIPRGAHGTTDHELEGERLGPPPAGFAL